MDLNEKENGSIFLLFLKGRQIEYISHFLVLKCLILYCRCTLDSVETFRKNRILWKWKTAFLKIYVLVVLWLYMPVLKKYYLLGNLYFLIHYWKGSYCEKKTVSSAKKIRTLALGFAKILHGLL